jgi:hypothetical protein
VVPDLHAEQRQLAVGGDPAGQRHADAMRIGGSAEAAVVIAGAVGNTARARPTRSMRRSISILFYYGRLGPSAAPWRAKGPWGQL